MMRLILFLMCATFVGCFFTDSILLQRCLISISGFLFIIVMLVATVGSLRR